MDSRLARSLDHSLSPLHATPLAQVLARRRSLTMLLHCSLDLLRPCDTQLPIGHEIRARVAELRGSSYMHSSQIASMTCIGRSAYEPRSGRAMLPIQMGRYARRGGRAVVCAADAMDRRLS